MEPFKTITECVNDTNKLYSKLNRKLKNFIISKRLSQGLTDIKQAIDDINLQSLHTQQSKFQQPKSIDQALKLEDNPEKPSSIKMESSHDHQILKIQDPIKQEQVFVQKQNVPNNELQFTKGGKNGVRGPYRQYSEQDKQTVIQMYEKGNSFSQIAKKLGIPSKNVIRWCRNGTQRKPGAGRKVLDPQMQQKLVQWITGKHERNQMIDVQIIRSKAKKLSNHQSFYASMGWFKNFIKRYDLKSKFGFFIYNQ